MPPSRKPRGRGGRTARPREKKANSLTCRNCRNRKIRCDGTLPSCGICQAYREECLYDKAPPMSQILAMIERIAELERATQGNATQAAKSMDESPLLILRDAIETATTPQMSPETVPPPAGASLIEALSQADMNAATDVHLTSANAYYDTTSSVHAPETVLQQEKTPTTTPSAVHTQATRETSKQSLVGSSHRQLQFWEDRVIESGSTELHLPADTVRHLLSTHWTWVHPAFMFVDRGTFLRDAAAGGDFYSPLLLSVLCLHSTRFTDHHLDEELLARTKLYLGHAMHQESSISLTQALLQHSAREIGRGNLSQAWLYSGMAFRTAIDLGLFTDAWKDQEGMGTEQLRRNRISRQLAWSCFLWDKVISLYFGRHPTLTEPPKLKFTFDAETDEAEMWQPYDADILNGLDYPPVPSHKLACFANFCKLGVIINDVLFTIYGRQRTDNVVDFVRETRQKLQTWRNDTPLGLRIDVSSSAEEGLHCPPQHILTQNMLYYTTIILLYRPFQSNASCRATCREAAEGVENLLLRIEQTFGLSRCTYAMAYCSYTAATVAVQDTKDGLAGAQRRLDTYLRALRALNRSCPGIQRSIEIISKCLASDAAAPPISQPRNGEDSTQQAAGDPSRCGNTTMEAAQLPPITNSVQSPGQQMPAFPFSYNNAPSYDGLGAGAFDSTQDLNPHMFSHLDSYPQDWLSMPSGTEDDFNMEYFGLEGPL